MNTQKTYTPAFIVRFEGTLTSGPNKGTHYSFHESWGGKLCPTLNDAMEFLAGCREREPDLAYRICERIYLVSEKRFGERVVWTDGN